MFETILLSLASFAEPFSISVAESLLALMLIASTITLYKERDFSIFKKSYTQFFFLMVLAETLSAVFGYDPAISFHSWFSFWVLMPLFCVYILFDGKNRERYFFFLFAAAIITVLYSIFQLPATTEHRARGFYSHSLTYGNMVAIIFIATVGFSLFTQPKNLKLRFFIYATGAFSLIGLLMSGSRGPILSAFVVILAMMIYRFRKKGVAIALAIVVLSTIVAITNPFIKGRFEHIETDIQQGSDSSVGTRFVLWEATSKAIMERPLFGYGKGNFKPVISKIVVVPVGSMAHAHNSYLQYTFTNGFFGMFALIMFLSALTRHILRAMKTNPYAKTALFVLIVYMLEGLTENNFSDSEVVMTAYTAIALLITPVREKTYHLFNKS